MWALISPFWLLPSQLIRNSVPGGYGLTRNDPHPRGCRLIKLRTSFHISPCFEAMEDIICGVGSTGHC